MRTLQPQVLAPCAAEASEALVSATRRKTPDGKCAAAVYVFLFFLASAGSLHTAAGSPEEAASSEVAADSELVLSPASRPAATSEVQRPAIAGRRVVKHFDFNETPLGNYESTPMQWRAHVGLGFPQYLEGRFDPSLGHDNP